MSRFPTIGVLVLTSSLFLACSQTNVTHGPGVGGVGNGGNGGSGGGAGGSSGTGGGIGGFGGGGDTDGGTANCGEQNFMLQKGSTPDILVVQDISGSMLFNEDGTLTSGVPAAQQRWTILRAGLEKVINLTSSTVDWGLELFPAATYPLQCVNTAVDVETLPGKATDIITLLNNTTPSGGTPTTDALKLATSYLQGLKDNNSHYIMLATDGEPNGCGSNATNAVAAVTAAAKAGIPTFVFGIGTETGDVDTLNKMAVAGGMPQMGGSSSYYPATDTTNFANTLAGIAKGLVSCTYPLTAAPPNGDYVEIDGNGKQIPRDKTHMNGWDFGPGNASIVFYGQACKDLQDGVITQVSAVYGCGPVT